MRGLKILLSFLQHAKTNVEKVKAAVKKNLKNSKKERIKDNIKEKKRTLMSNSQGAQSPEPDS